MDFSKGDHGTCETVRVVAEVTDDNPQGYIVINKSDYDSAKHTLYEVEEATIAINYSKMNKSDLSKALTAGGVKHDDAMSKADLVALAEKNL